MNAVLPRRAATALASLILITTSADAQMQHDSGMQMNEAGMYLMNVASGTGMNPRSWPMPMLMERAGAWNLMFMGQAFVIDTQQSGPRGGDKFYSPNWWMGSAERSL